MKNHGYFIAGMGGAYISDWLWPWRTPYGGLVFGLLTIVFGVVVIWCAPQEVTKRDG